MCLGHVLSGSYYPGSGKDDTCLGAATTLSFIHCQAFTLYLSPGSGKDDRPGSSYYHTVIVSHSLYIYPQGPATLGQARMTGLGAATTLPAVASPSYRPGRAQTSFTRPTRQEVGAMIAKKSDFRVLSVYFYGNSLQ